MKMLFFLGDFSWDGENTHHGLICFCHFNKGDDESILRRAQERINQEARRIRITNIELSYDLRLVLVPFSELDIKENTMSFNEAEVAYNKLFWMLTDVTAMPFFERAKFMLSGKEGTHVCFAEIKK